MSEKKEYIERGAFLNWLNKRMDEVGTDEESRFYVNQTMTILESYPAADVEPVVRGKWTPNKRHAGFMVCDQCRFGIPINTMVVMECNRRSDEREFSVCAGDVELAYCPNCGAYMERSGSGE